MDSSWMQAGGRMPLMKETDETRAFPNVAVPPTAHPVAICSDDAIISSEQQKQQHVWRTRDAASELMKARRPSSSVMPYSQFEDPEHLLAMLQRGDNAEIVRAAFDAAATSVLQALKADNETSDFACTSTTVPPPSKSVFDTLQELRDTSIARAVNNKTTVSSAIAAASSQKTTAAATKKDTKPKGTRKISIKSLAQTTPEAVALETRSTVSHAVLCAAASICFEELTPPPHAAKHEPMVGDAAAKDIPQKHDVNMGAVLLQAQTLGNRAASLAKNAAKRATLRYNYRRDNLKSDLKNGKSRALMKKSLKNLFAKKKDNVTAESLAAGEELPEMSFPPPPASSDTHLTPEWKTQCAPRLLQVLQEGAGHALYCDVEWATRYKRICDLLQQLPNDKKHGPHLIVTSQSEVQAFAQEFDTVQVHRCSSSSTDKLRVLSYTGSQKQRCSLRENFALAKGLPESPFHVMVVSYTTFLQDYVHLCQLPYQVALIDDGFSWMAAAHMDPNSSIGSLWESAIWNASDEHVGLAGTRPTEWDFTTQTPNINEALIGLTARHRILTTSSMSHRHRDLVVAPVPALLRFLVPHFLDVVREEWDRSKIHLDDESMEHFRKLLSRSIVVHHPTAQHDMHHLAMNALKGRLPSGNRLSMPAVAEVIPEDVLVSEGKLSYNRRVSTLQWFQPISHSWLLYELGKASFKPVLDAMQDSDLHGFICEAVITASSITTAGAGGAITGPMAYRLGLRCGRKFGSEAGLRQHMAGMHAPPGTWLCRTCGADCGTTQFRTHHERSCGQPTAGDQGGGAPTVGQGVGSKNPSSAKPKGRPKKVPKGVPSKSPQDKDPDGSFRVPGYRGVWINKGGSYFVKINDERLANQKDDDPGSTLLFETSEEAARKYDEILTSRSCDKDTPELNYRPDGSRIVYEYHAPAATTGRGIDLVGGASSDVVPALSVINIKDLPKDVKPLLRDPRQTSRTGANAKRHVYAYRGVCRQSRKGHDRWQSQISFNGSNNYLGTFDSEWDAAAVYAWAHLILYGEEATKKAQMEGEEAVAAYEQEKKDIAAGKIPAPPPKPEKKKPRPKKKDESGNSDGSQKVGEKADKSGDGKDEEPKKKRKRVPKATSSTSKRGRASPKSAREGDLEMVSMLSKAVAKVPALDHRKAFETISDEAMLTSAGSRLAAARKLRSSFMALALSSPTDGSLQPCEPIQSKPLETVHAGAILMGLPSILFGWDVKRFISAYSFQFGEDASAASLILSQEYDPEGFNESFRTALRGSTCVIGRASRVTEEACRSLQLDIPLGGTIGALDCHIGGSTISCSESAATIQFCPSSGSDFQVCANNDTDLVTLNGQRITKRLGSFPLSHGDVCTVGCRVFAFLAPLL